MKYFIYSVAIVIFIIILVFGIEYIDNDNNYYYERFNDSCITKYSEKEVRGDSMSPLIKAGETLILLEGYYDCNDVKRGDIIAYNYAGSENPIIKKVAVLGGDKLEFTEKPGNSAVYYLIVNSEMMLNSQDSAYEFSENNKKMISSYIEKGNLVKYGFLIFGDNINFGLDSRRFGAVGKIDFIGRFIIKD